MPNLLKPLLALSLLGAGAALSGCSNSSAQGPTTVPGAPKGAQPQAGAKMPSANQGPPTGAMPGAHR